MKKRRFVIIGMLMVLVILAGIFAGRRFIGRDDYKKLSRPDRIELDIPMTAGERHYEFQPGEEEFEEIYKLVKADWDNTRKQDGGEMIYLQLDYLDEERDQTGTAIHFYYETPRDWGKKNLVEYAHYYSFFPNTLEFAAVTEKKNYYEAANLPRFAASGELKHYVTGLKRMVYEGKEKSVQQFFIESFFKSGGNSVISIPMNPAR